MSVRPSPVFPKSCECPVAGLTYCECDKLRVHVALRDELASETDTGEFHSTVTATLGRLLDLGAVPHALPPMPACGEVGTDCPAAWGMTEVHGEWIRSERRFGREAVLSPKRLFGRFCRLVVPVMRDSVVEWAS